MTLDVNGVKQGKYIVKHFKGFVVDNPITLKMPRTLIPIFDTAWGHYMLSASVAGDKITVVCWMFSID